MARFTLTLTDDEVSGITMAADYGDAVDETSVAHSMGSQLIEAVLRSSKTYTTIEDTAPEHNVEPSRILTPDNPN